MHIALLFAAVVSGLIWGIVHLQRELRRREWAKKNITPLYSIDKPRDLVAVLCFALLKSGGDITREQKESLLKVYEDELQFTQHDAAEMYSYASYLLSTDPNFSDKARRICAPALESFTDEQRKLGLGLLRGLLESPTDDQLRFLGDVEGVLGGSVGR